MFQALRTRLMTVRNVGMIVMFTMGHDLFSSKLSENGTILFTIGRYRHTPLGRLVERFLCLMFFGVVLLLIPWQGLAFITCHWGKKYCLISEGVRWVTTGFRGGL